MHVAGDEVVALMGQTGPVGPALARLVRAASTRLLDARMLIDEGLHLQTDPRLPRETIRREVSGTETLDRVETLVAAIRTEGLAPHLRALLAAFGATLVAMCGNEDQQARTRRWGEDGRLGVYLMTDSGGPSLDAWETRVVESPQGRRLRIDKIDAVDAHEADFAIVVARGRNPLVPSLFLLGPEAMARLDRRPIGDPFLGGALQLGGVRGEVLLDAGCPLTRGGFTGASMFLSVVRPRFVRALLAHVEWLVEVGRARPDRRWIDAAADLRAVAEAASHRTDYSALSVNVALAVKLASNELLLDLVVSDAVPDVADQRDLLAFTRMEGSSYRCFFEIHRARR